MTHHRITLCVSAALLAFSGAAAHADEIQYKSGGIGESQVRELKQEAKQYSTGLTFANNSGEFLGDVQVTITRPDGQEVLNTVTEGPILLVNLPPGRYTLKAEGDGRSTKRSISVPARGRLSSVVHI